MSSKYRAYPEYKDSGVEWLGNIPYKWEVIKLKFLIQNLESGVSVNAADYPVSGDEIGVLKTSCVYTRRFRANENKKVFGEEISRVKCPVKMDSIIISRMNTPDLVGAAAYVDTEYSNLFLPDRLWQTTYYTDNRQHSKYIYYFMMIKGFRQQIANSAEGASSSMQNIAQKNFLNLEVFLPQYYEQVQVSSFLDYETTKIDILIKKQKHLIKLLKEKRQAVISHAVTKGLNSDVKMKDSGVEWLGDVPEHWKVKRIGHLFSESSKRATTNDEQDYPILTVSIHNGISNKELTEEESNRKLQRSDDKSLYKVVHDNYLTYNMMRAWQGAFGAAKLSGLVSPAYVICQPKTEIDSYYFELALRTPNAVTELKRFSRGITDFRLRLYWDEFKTICVPVPPASEIKQIIASIAKIIEQYDHLVTVAKSQIELLQERRSALISAAVTGKIDVRDWQAPEREAA